MRRVFAAALLVASLCATPSPASAQSRALYDFLEAVGCSQLPMGACELLSPENARNIAATHQAFLLRYYCGNGTGGVAGARALLEVDAALHPSECRTLVNSLGG